jgi:ribosomal protein S7
MLLIKRRHKNELQPMSKIWSSTFKKLQSFTEIKKVTWGKGRKARTNLIPFPLKRKRQNFLKIKWILDSIKEDQRKVNLSLKLADELWNIKYNEKNSKALLKKKDIRKLVLANRSNSHYRW